MATSATPTSSWTPGTWRTRTLGEVADPAETIARIDAIRPVGDGIYFYSILHEAREALRREPGGIRHVLVLCDAEDIDQYEVEGRGHSFDLLRSMAAEGMTVSILSVGRPTDKDVPFLRTAALLGRGDFYLVPRIAALPRYFVSEYRRISSTRHFLEEELQPVVSEQQGWRSGARRPPPPRGGRPRDPARGQPDAVDDEHRAAPAGRRRRTAGEGRRFSPGTTATVGRRAGSGGRGPGASGCSCSSAPRPVKSAPAASFRRSRPTSPAGACAFTTPARTERRPRGRRSGRSRRTARQALRCGSTASGCEPTAAANRWARRGTGACSSPRTGRGRGHCSRQATPWLPPRRTCRGPRSGTRSIGWSGGPGVGGSGARRTWRRRRASGSASPRRGLSCSSRSGYYSCWRRLSCGHYREE